MSNELGKKLDELKSIQDELVGSGLSRRRFLDRLKAVGLGFGAAMVLGIRESDALAAIEPVSIKSTNSAVDTVMTEGQDAMIGAENGPADPDGQPIETAQFLPYARVYGRGGPRYARVYGRGLPYARGYARGLPYARVYTRYARVYNRFYRRF
jgi:hypothetical protein